LRRSGATFARSSVGRELKTMLVRPDFFAMRCAQPRRQRSARLRE
jgi:hypothetical protein